MFSVFFRFSSVPRKDSVNPIFNGCGLVLPVNMVSVIHDLINDDYHYTKN